MVFKGFMLYFWLPCFGIWFSYKLFAWDILDRNWVIRPYTIFHMSRQTGMVKLYDKRRKIFEAPFIEFDPWLTSTYDRFGGYGLILIHRSSNVA